MKKMTNFVQKNSYPEMFPSPWLITRDDSLTWLPEDEITALHFHNICEAGICRHGEGLWVVEDTVSAIKQGDVMIVPPGVRHYSRAICDCVCEFIYFDGDKLLSSCKINIEKTLPKNVSSVLNGDSKEYIRSMIESEDVTESALWYALFLNKLSHENTPPSPVYNSKLFGAVQLITTSYQNDLTNDILAAECGFSKSWFIKEFNREYHMTPMEFLNNFRVKVATELLKGDMSITEISEKVGFGSPSDLYRHFKKIKNISPSLYRKDNRK